ncbi:hypothetical protein EVAR_101450_1, partial [Eumeta japonica]
VQVLPQERNSQIRLLPGSSDVIRSVIRRYIGAAFNVNATGSVSPSKYLGTILSLLLETAMHRNWLKLMMNVGDLNPGPLVSLIDKLHKNHVVVHLKEIYENKIGVACCGY